MRREKMKRRPRFFINCFLVVMFVLTVAVFVFFDNIVTYSINSFTDYDISFIQWNKSLFDKNIIQGLQISSKKHNILVSVDSAQVYIDVLRFFKENKSFVDLDLKGVRFSYLEGNSSNDFSVDSLYSLFVGPDQKFNSVSSLLLWDDDTFSISELNADSQNIKILGRCEFSDTGNKADIDIKLSISPSLVSVLDPEVRTRVLVQEDNGWYSTIINYKGSTVLLKALYRFSEAK